MSRLSIGQLQQKGRGKEGQGLKKLGNGPKILALQVVEVDDVFENAYMITESSILHMTNDIQWITDTGATAHIAPFRNIFSSYKEASPDSIV